MDKIRRIIFVCTGNMGRSPMALAAARREAENRKLSVELDSYGTCTFSGCPAERESVEACASAGLDISDHVTKSAKDIQDTDDTLYAVMSREHKTWLRVNKNIPGSRIVLLGNGISDPCGGSPDEYKDTLDGIIAAVHALFNLYSKNISKQ